MINRRALFSSAALLAAAPLVPAIAQEDEPPVNADGLYDGGWFHISFLDMAEDHADAAAQGKNLMVLYEQLGCPYCRELHRVNFAREEILSYMLDNYLVVQLNLWGDREVTDFDGEVLSEKNLARKWGVMFTPTTILFNARDAGATTLAQAEAFRMPGYFKPFHFISGLEFGASDVYRDEYFQRFLQARFDRLEAQGIDPDLW